jgi:hypothetical protein
MKLVELSVFNAEYQHRQSYLVNPDHVIFITDAQGFSDRATCWLRLSSHHEDFLVLGSLSEIAQKLDSGYDR